MISFSGRIVELTWVFCWFNASVRLSNRIRDSCSGMIGIPLRESKRSSVIDRDSVIVELSGILGNSDDIPTLSTDCIPSARVNAVILFVELVYCLRLFSYSSSISQSTIEYSYIVASSIIPLNRLDCLSSPRSVFWYAPMTTSAVDAAMFGGPVSSLPSSVPFTYMEMREPFTTAATYAVPLIGVLPVTVYQDIPSYTENFAILSGDIILFSDRTNEFSLDRTVNSGEPPV